ncbi:MULTISPECIES: LysM peptidoglycan-binding domain-containing protein [Brevibacillus]|uniref:LysM peptidoglycan-binding domain-containing protein n=1 Tax=Brevibacillus TaxID=55080 RepID=UPI000B9B756A|nr:MULTISPECIES: LysM peptidoglycan-binding domain-containing protein [Brevibacillus]MBG9787173.1 peptidoglycan-binding protein LysM [Brevibacillus laterosporus]MCG7317110.1 LysM peptidoglycan-binding domain-containing protein [Brevibacillus laterosporus]MED1790843.1 LysM peptidoglycan-binding domain-containing protein [Brevibacillus laterosporus]RFB32668.1 LysM peptidoglycan-binding domain-containing protein [Brevibacillus sp. VP]
MNYIVQRGDTLYSIAQRYGVPIDVIIRANRLRPPYALYVGQPLYIPQQVVPNPSPNDADEDRRIARLEREVARLNERYRDLNRRVRALEQRSRT